MKYITTVLITAFIILSGVYIYEDSQRYEVKPCTPPIIIEEPIIIHDTIEVIIPVEQEQQQEQSYTNHERELLARAVMSEGSSLPMHGKIAIVATIMDRVRSDKYPNTIEEVLYKTGFSLGDNGNPTEDCYLAIDNYVPEGWPSDMYWFRDSKPHSYGYEYLHIGNMYFNTDTNYE